MTSTHFNSRTTQEQADFGNADRNKFQCYAILMHTSQFFMYALGVSNSATDQTLLMDLNISSYTPIYYLLAYFVYELLISASSAFNLHSHRLESVARMTSYLFISSQRLLPISLLMIAASQKHASLFLPLPSILKQSDQQ